MDVLISIQPKWCELIANGLKTIEVRKTKPKLDTPFKCFIYQTQPKRSLIDVVYDGDDLYGETYHGKTAFITVSKDVHAGSCTYGLWGKVIGEFVCNNIYEWEWEREACEEAFDGEMAYNIPTVIGEQTGLEYDEFAEYGDGKTLYGWSIYDLKIYDKPKELGEFHRPCNPACNFSEECGGSNAADCLFGIHKAPQSWMYVEG